MAAMRFGWFRRRLGGRLGGDRLQSAYGRFDVVDVELAEQLHGEAADVLAEALIQSLTGGGQVSSSPPLTRPSTSSPARRAWASSASKPG